MSRRRRRPLLVPEARAALDALRDKVITEQSAASPVARTPDLGMKSQPVQPYSQSSTPGQNQSSPGVAGVANQLGIPYQQQNNGDLTTRQAGKIGGAIGGSMIQRLISIAEQELAKEQTNPRPR